MSHVQHSSLSSCSFIVYIEPTLSHMDRTYSNNLNNVLAIELSSYTTGKADPNCIEANDKEIVALK